MVPPLVGVAVKVIEEPAHVGLLPAVIAIETAGTKVAFNVIVIPPLIAVVGLAQVALEVSTQVIMSPLTKAAFVYVGLFAPTFVPFSFH